ncbi:magnesium transporter [Phycisphaera mikurensis]|uniref:Putative magnesium transporter n=1 Tax=Phycisphaera mikurensis (strain NBRC 102666 / KCTC 22515 / FYK2301M01) TaxID=1142394 RepID=I0IGS9_PHYMF|nr:magnesium transporter [Phycisphaera mikurensis]MBB6443256.1 magnesium transporter [Phycisphaera mikurensis]BAM04467.1 putative magnesium transporter [Phycisphaera mikurensis NBRC 102666]
MAEPHEQGNGDGNGATAAAADHPAELPLRLAADVREATDAQLVLAVRDLPPEETAWTVDHLSPDDQQALLDRLARADPGLAADLLEHFDDSQAAALLREVDPAAAALVVIRMDSDEQADVLAEMSEAASGEILRQLPRTAAADLRQRLGYPDDTAGGLMITEIFRFDEADAVEDVVRRLREGAAEEARDGEGYRAYEVRYLYTTDAAGRLSGVVPMRRLVLGARSAKLATLAIRDFVKTAADTPVEELEDLFDRVDYSAVPVEDARGRLLGVVQRAAVQEHRGEAAEEDLAKTGGIIGGEELRSMPVGSRAGRRLAFLLPVLGLTLVSASVIGLYEPTIRESPGLAKFLPVVAGLCGSSGGQAVAVSMREISLGLIKTRDVGRVIRKEVTAALLIGAGVGLALFLTGWAWSGDLGMGLTLGFAAPPVMLLATAVGGSVPLLLRGVGLDPAMMSGPVVQTTIDMAAFLAVLAIAAAVL